MNISLRAFLGGVALVCALTIHGCGTSPAELAGLDSETASSGPKAGVVSPDPAEEPVTVTEGPDPVPVDGQSGDDPSTEPDSDSNGDDPPAEGEDIDAPPDDEGNGEDEVSPQGPKTGDRILIKFRPGTPASSRSALHRQSGLQVDRIIPQLHVHAVKIPPGKTAEEVMARYERHPLVESVEQDQIFEEAMIPNDPWYQGGPAEQWYLPQIGAPAAWDVTTGDSSVIIAILDSGIFESHEDIGSSKMVRGWNVRTDSADTTPVRGHGTAVAGIAAAAGNNGIGMASVAWGSRMMPIVVSNEYGQTSTAILAAGLTWAADHGARVANMSFEIFDTPTLRAGAQYFEEQGGVVVQSAGNSGIFDPDEDNPYLLKVSGTDANDGLATFSATGNNVDLAAPAVSLITTDWHGTYSNGTGTSFSAPIVSGVAALTMSANPDLSGQQVQDILEQSADDFGSSGWDPSYGWGRVNAARAVQLAGGAEPPVDDTPPSVTLVDPTTGEVLSGTATVLADAADDTAVARVDLYRDSTFVSSDTVPPHQWHLDTTTLADGPHTFRAVAFDTVGNSGISAWVGVTVDNGRCGSPQDCDDADACTTDLCVEGACSNSPYDCDDGDASTADSCDPATGCVYTSIDCNDDNACTVDSSDAVNGCAHAAVDCDDHNACTLDSCDAVSGCVHDAIFCDDGDAYTSDSCDPATGCVHAPVDCDDGNVCTVDSLDPATGCKNTPMDCDDHNACTADQCDSANGCVHPAIGCDDGDACTTDSCDPASGCLHAPVNCPSGQLCVNGVCEALVCNTNGICEEEENCNNCPADCSAGQGAACGNGACEAGNGEDCVTCPADCNGKQDGKPEKRFCCGAGGGENPLDCGDPRCNSSGSACVAVPVADSCCGDGVCDGIESGCECAVDCGAPDSTESAGATCRDGLDNDCDGDTDCFDSDCASDAICIACNYNGVCEPGEDCHACAGDCDGKRAGRSGNSFCCGNGIPEGPEGDGGVCDGNP